ncbi:hypothetical protein [Massilia endophytica]|uniref:hypothetical protein n=1 Tax=Massilia endophytica TaxID=2899220 RepID=UPI001E321ECE|nr:hypothetical protein [Massilia endophytica]UGQ44627.1 hypothetical protein LSQ66_12495 [Massilia endophytica]
MNPDESGLSAEERRAVRSWRRQIERHQRKIEDFQRQRSVRRGMEAMPDELIEAQRVARIRHLESEIRTFERSIDAVLSKGSGGKP